MGDRAVQRSLHRFGVTASKGSAATNGDDARGAGDSSDRKRPKPLLFNLLTGGSENSVGSFSKGRRRRKRREGEEGESDGNDDGGNQSTSKKLRREQQQTTATKTTETTTANSPSLLAPCPVCGALFKRGVELDAHVASEVAIGLSGDVGDGEARGPTSPSAVAVVAVVPRPPALFLRQQQLERKGSAFELGDATAAPPRTSSAPKPRGFGGISSTVSLEEARSRLEGDDRRRRRTTTDKTTTAILRVPRSLLSDSGERFNHYADGGGNWGEDTLGIDGASGATAWQARGVSGIGDPFGGGARGGDVGGD